MLLHMKSQRNVDPCLEGGYPISLSSQLGDGYESIRSFKNSKISSVKCYCKRHLISVNKHLLQENAFLMKDE